MDRSDLELVLAVRDHGSLTAAALSLDVAPPVVTKRLAALEVRLGQRLFQRTTRRVSPTAEGETVCERARVLLQGFTALEAELQERKAEPTGSQAILPSLLRPQREVDEDGDPRGRADLEGSEGERPWSAPRAVWDNEVRAGAVGRVGPRPGRHRRCSDPGAGGRRRRR